MTEMSQMKIDEFMNEAKQEGKFFFVNLIGGK